LDELERNNWTYDNNRLGLFPDNNILKPDDVPEKPEGEAPPDITDENPADEDMNNRKMLDLFNDNFKRRPVLIAKVDSDNNISSVRNDIFYMESDYILEMVTLFGCQIL
jgi:hypothetical protein